MDLLNRAFIAIRPPAEVCELIERAVMQIKRKPGVIDIRWNNPSEYLVNLVSLGEVSPATLAMVCPAVQRVVSICPTFQLDLVRFAGIPNMIQPRFATLQVAGEGENTLCQIASDLDKTIAPLVPPRDRKPFVANIVLGRLKTESEQMRVALGRALKIPEHPPIGSWQVRQLDLLISQGTSQGTTYKVVESFNLVS